MRVGNADVHIEGRLVRLARLAVAAVTISTFDGRHLQTAREGAGGTAR